MWFLRCEMRASSHMHTQFVRCATIEFWCSAIQPHGDILKYWRRGNVVALEGADNVTRRNQSVLPAVCGLQHVMRNQSLPKNAEFSGATAP